MHLANQNLIDRVARARDVSSALFFCNIRQCGNTSSASMLTAWEWFARANLLLAAMSVSPHSALTFTGAQSLAALEKGSISLL